MACWLTAGQLTPRILLLEPIVKAFGIARFLATPPTLVPSPTLISPPTPSFQGTSFCIEAEQLASSDYSIEGGSFASGGRYISLLGQVNPGETGDGVVLLMAGTNDVLQGDNVNSMLTELQTLVDSIATALPNTQILLASVIPNASSSTRAGATTECSNRIQGEIVNPSVAAGKRVSFVDVFNTPGIDTNLLSDEVHLTPQGMTSWV
ncbi:MAG: hypothetical protein F6K19_06505 [Cyanothece sp. SIO1E1]|nr:hypothetical protein [Cyanothece sp. SIO1E1]